MAPTAFIFTSSPFLLSQVPLASFVPYKSQPHQDAEVPYEVKDEDFAAQPDESFDGLMNSSSSSSVSALLTKFTSLSLQRDESSALRVTAKKGCIYSLRKPDSLFEHIVFGKETGEDMQRWLERCRRRKIQPHFVIALRTFTDARITNDENRVTGIEGKGTAPISTAAGDPTGTADIAVQASHHSKKGMKRDMVTTGQRIYAICYRKISISYHDGVATHSLDHKNKWKPFAAPRGEGDAEDYFQAGLKDEDDVDGYDLYRMEAPGGELLTFGILPEQIADDYGMKDGKSVQA